MNYSYKKRGGHFQVSDESGRHVCNVIKKPSGWWMAWIPPHTIGQHARSRAAAVAAELISQRLREG